MVLGDAAFFMEASEDVDIDQHLEVLTQPDGWHEHATLNVDTMSVDALVDLLNS
jgi:hypothetical protein